MHAGQPRGVRTAFNNECCGTHLGSTARGQICLMLSTDLEQLLREPIFQGARATVDTSRPRNSFEVAANDVRAHCPRIHVLRHIQSLPPRLCCKNVGARLQVSKRTHCQHNCVGDSHPAAIMHAYSQSMLSALHQVPDMLQHPIQDTPMQPCEFVLKILVKESPLLHGNRYPSSCEGHIIVHGIENRGLYQATHQRAKN